VAAAWRHLFFQIGGTMRKTIVSFVSLFALAISASAFGEIRKEEDAKIQYDVPAGMTAASEGDWVGIEEDKKADADKEIGFYIYKFAKADQDKAMAEVDKFLGGFLTDVKTVAEPKESTLNGMKAVVMKANAKFGGKPADVGMMIVQTPGSKMAVITSVVLQSKKEAWKAAAQKFVASIKPL
jgi:hypothetical protein